YQRYVNFGKAEGRSATNPADAEKVARMQEEIRELTISFAGDCTLGGFKGQGGGNLLRDYYELYGNDYFFQNVKEIFEQDDITYVNLEGALTRYPQVVEKKFPIKGEPEYVGALLSGSIEVVNLANNHTYDCGQAGYDSCRQLLADNGIAYCGEMETCILERNGIKTGFIGLNCWEMNNSLAKKLQNLITHLRDNGCNIICVMFHGGIEREYESNATTEAFAHRAIDYGADIVVGAHPHVVQGIEIYQGKVICYSLGNFSFGANKNPSDKDTFIFQQSFFVDNAGNVSYGESNVIPCKVSSTDTKNDYCPTPQTGAEYDRIVQKLARYSQKYPVSYFDRG
ncbi:MAG: CapA family protein, partial [Lachnospiraceae bacterium]|nr:CapA family protein [Lachnospiraceae bacterium]